MPLRIAVCVSGEGSNLQALLDALAGSDSARVVLVLSNNPAAGGLARARRAGVSTEVLLNPASGAEWLERLTRAGVDLVVLAGYLKLVPTEVTSANRGRILNIHPSLLPAFGGAGMYGRRVHQAVLASGAATTGATVHLVNETYDQGVILAQRTVPVVAGDTPDTLAARVLAVEHQLLPAVVLAAARAGRPVPLPEPLESPT